MEFTLFYKNDKLQTTFFNWDSEKQDNYDEIGPRSHAKFIAAWFSLCRETFGLTLKPKLMQIRYKLEVSKFSECLLGDSNMDSGSGDEEGEVESIVSLDPENCFDMRD